MEKFLSRWLPNLAFVLVGILFIIAGNLIFGMIKEIGFFSSFLSSYWQNCWEDGVVLALVLLIGGATRLGVATWLKNKGGNQ